MKIKGIEATNFKGIEKINVEFNDGHTSIIGLNGSGKTSLIDVIRGCIKGVSQKSSKGELVGERFRFIGPHGKTADLKVTLKDEKGGFDVIITNKVTKASNGIEFKASDGSTLDRQWLNDFFNVAFLSAKNFIERTPKEQALLLGIDTSKYDEEIKELKSEFTLINRDIKAFGTIPVVEKVDPVDLNALYKGRDRIKAHNQQQEARRAEIDKYKRAVEDQKSRIKAIKESLKREEDDLSFLQDTLGDLPVAVGQQSIELNSINNQIDEADDTNLKANEYLANAEKAGALKIKVDQLLKNKAEQDKVNDKRTNYIKAFDFKSDGLSVDEDGGLLLNGRRLTEFSKGEQEVIVAGLYASLDPELKVRIIDEFQSLDAPNQKKIVDGLINKGFQVITLEVGDKKKDKNTILLRECSVVDEEEENKPVKPKLL
jgi:predicted ATP-dependent endonuclease of OLD family